MKITDITKALDVALRSNDAVHMVGKHGIGKSQIVNQWAKDRGYECEVLQLPILEVSDLIGMPNIVDSKEGSKTEWAAPEWVHRVIKNNKEGIPTVIFMDELARSSLDIRQASLQIILEKRVNEHYFDPALTVMVAADNPSDEYDSAEFDMALEDRFMSFDVEPDIDGWLHYARSTDVLSVVSDYLAEFVEKLHYTPETDGEKGSSPRAWKKLSDALKENKDESFVYSLINSKIGKTVGSNFFHFYNNYIDIIKVPDILNAIDIEINTEKDQKKAAKKLSSLTKKIEVISAQELAQKLLISKDVSDEVLLVYLASLNTETAAGILKSWKDSKDDQKAKEWYNNGFLNAQTDSKWFIRKLTDNIKV